MPRSPEAVPDAILRLALCPGAGPAFHHAALARFGTPEGVVRAGPRELAGLVRAPGFDADAVAGALRSVDPAEERAEMARIGAVGLAWGDPDYPRLLAPLPQPPILLWVRGDAAALSTDAVAVVGARRATPYGEAQAARFAGAAAADGVTVVSGGARGIDAAAHRAALRAGGRTVAVLGCGLGEPYPPEHASLFESIARGGGALVSEFPVRWPPLASNFPRRNRIISGLSLAVLVVEAGEVSGALITARLALEEHHRDPCAVPGPVDSPRSTGTNAAIRDGWARCVLSPDDLRAAIADSPERSVSRPAQAPAPAAQVQPTA